MSAALQQVVAVKLGIALGDWTSNFLPVAASFHASIPSSRSTLHNVRQCERLPQPIYYPACRFWQSSIDMALSALPEELLLRICSHLHRLDDLYVVMLTSKQLNRISRDVSPAAISRMALQTGDFLPGLRPHRYFLLVSSARPLSDWARHSKQRETRLQIAFKGGMSSLTAFALSAVPITLDDIRETWRWKTEIVNPLGRRLRLSCGRTEDGFTCCEDAEVALFQWAIYGELFDHLLYVAKPTSAPGLSSVTRFRYLTYCVPDTNCFAHLAIEPPDWFKTIANNDPEAYQQLSLNEALRAELTIDAFAEAIMYLTELELSTMQEDSGPRELRDREFLYVHRVMHSGKRSLEVLHYAADSSAPMHCLDAIKQWLSSIASPQDVIIEAAEISNTASGSLNARDPWLDSHKPSLHNDVAYTLWADMRYRYRHDAWGDDVSADRALRRTIAA